MNFFKIFLIALILCNTSCASYIVAKSSQREINLKKVQSTQTHTQNFVGIDLLSLENLTNQPLEKIAALIIDGFIVWQTYQATKPDNINKCECNCIQTE